MHDEDEEKGVICDGCTKRRARMRFSNKQWESFVQRKFMEKSRGKNADTVKRPICRECNGEPAEEKQCVSCEKLLRLDKFSKSARKQRDNARCIDCTQEREDLEADPHAAVVEQRIYDQLESQGGASAYSMKSLASGLNSDIGSRGYGTVSNSGTNPRSEPGKVWIEDESESRLGPISVKGKEPSVSRRSEHTEKPGGSVPSVSSNGTWEGFRPIESRQRKPTSSPSVTSSNAGFAKQGAWRPGVEERALSKFEKDRRKAKDVEEEADDSDDSRSDDSDFEL